MGILIQNSRTVKQQLKQIEALETKKFWLSVLVAAGLLGAAITYLFFQKNTSIQYKEVIGMELDPNKVADLLKDKNTHLIVHFPKQPNADTITSLEEYLKSYPTFAKLEKNIYDNKPQKQVVVKDTLTIIEKVEAKKITPEKEEIVVNIAKEDKITKKKITQVTNIKPIPKANNPEIKAQKSISENIDLSEYDKHSEEELFEMLQEALAYEREAYEEFLDAKEGQHRVRQDALRLSRLKKEEMERTEKAAFQQQLKDRQSSQNQGLSENELQNKLKEERRLQSEYLDRKLVLQAENQAFFEVERITQERFRDTKLELDIIKADREKVEKAYMARKQK